MYSDCFVCLYRLFLGKIKLMKIPNVGWYRCCAGPTLLIDTNLHSLSLWCQLHFCKKIIEIIKFGVRKKRSTCWPIIGYREPMKHLIFRIYKISCIFYILPIFFFKWWRLLKVFPGRSKLLFPLLCFNVYLEKNVMIK